jgi:hypothetical protein
VSAINWTARAREFLKTAPPQTDETDEMRVLSVSSVCIPVVREKDAPSELGARPYRLSQSEADAAHVEPWDDAAIGRFTARVVLLMRRGINATDADDLAERLHLRDLQGDDRRVCLECRHLSGRRCGNHVRAGLRSAEVGAELAALLQRCQGFAL